MLQHHKKQLLNSYKSMLSENVIWISDIQIEFTGQFQRTVAYVTIEKLFAGCKVVIHRVSVVSDDVNVHDLEFTRHILQHSEKDEIKRIFKNTSEAKQFVKDKSIDGNYILFDLKNRKDKTTGVRRISIYSSRKITEICYQYEETLKKLSNLFKQE